ncbi:unnamed protein product, partial [Symbiodinium necroappetens]
VSLAGKFKESLTKELRLDITDATFSPSVASEATVTEENVYVLTEERLYQAIKFHEADASFFRSDLNTCKNFLIDKYLHMDACSILRRIHKRIGEVTWEVMDSTASRVKNAVHGSPFSMLALSEKVTGQLEDRSRGAVGF